MEAFGSFSKQIAEAITRIFFCYNSIYAVFKEFFLKLATTILTLQHVLCQIIVISRLPKMIRARSQRQKAAAIVVNRYLSSAANDFFFDLQ